MRIRLDFLKERLDEIAFVELKHDMRIEDRVVLPREVPLPVTARTIRDKVSGEASDFSQAEFIDGILFLMGLDPDFKHKEAYRRLLEAIDPDFLQIQANALLAAVDPDNRIVTLIRLVGVAHLGLEDPILLVQLGRLAHTTYLETTRDDFDRLAERLFMYLKKHEIPHPIPYFHLGYYAYNAGRYSEAQQLWEKSVELGLGEEERAALIEIHPQLQHRLTYESGVDLILKGRYLEGVEQLLSLREVLSEWWNLMFFIGLGYRYQEDYRKALYYLERALDLKPDGVDILNEIGICHTMTGEWDQAIMTYTHALSLAPENHEILCNMGIAHEQAGDRKTAVRYIRRAFEIQPEDPVTRQWMAYLKINDSN